MICHLCGHNITEMQLAAMFEGRLTNFIHKDVCYDELILMCSECLDKLQTFMTKDDEEREA